MYAMNLRPYQNEGSASARWLHMYSKICISSEFSLRYDLLCLQYRERSASFRVPHDAVLIWVDCTYPSKDRSPDAVHYFVYHQE